MAKKTVKITDKKCYACGKCISACPEKALQIIDNKARLLSDIYCDCFKTCKKSCPENAISIETRNDEQYDERRFMTEIIIPQGKNTIIAHLRFLQNHLESDYHKIALDVLREHGLLFKREALGRNPHRHKCSINPVTTSSKEKDDDNK